LNFTCESHQHSYNMTVILFLEGGEEEEEEEEERG
jgi:hypothetical protein